MKNRTLISTIIIILIVVITFIVALYLTNDDVSNSETTSTQQVNNEVKEDIISQESTNLVTVGSFTGIGTGTATRIFNNEFVHTVTAEIPAPQSGRFYEGWLVKGSSFFSTGKMELSDGSYYLEYTNPIDKSDYNEVVITLETEVNGLDGIPEAHVLEGNF